MKQEILRAFEMFNKIQHESSLNAKQNILLNYSNDVSKVLLKLTYDPFQQFFIKKIPDVTLEKTHGLVENYHEFLKLVIKLSQRQITGNLAISELENFFKHLTPTEYLWYSKVIQKDLKIGLATTGINKAFPKLIPTYEVQLAEKIPQSDLSLTTAKALKLLPESMVVQYKIDGYRLNIFRPSIDVVILKTRNGKVVSGYSNLEKSALSLPVGYVYDGEIVSPELYETIQFNITNGTFTENRNLFNEVMSHAFSKEENKHGIFNVFDVVPLQDWNYRSSNILYKQRLDFLNNIVKPLNLPDIVVVPTSRVYHKNNSKDLQEIVSIFHKFISIGWEGLMIKDINAVYQWKRTKALLKMKLMNSLDLVVENVYEGNGKYQNYLGGVIVDYKGFKVSVGSGFSEQQREYFWKNKNEILGKTVEIAYQSISNNKNGGKSLSFPIFKRIRVDK